MNTKGLVLAGILAGAPAAAFGYSHVGFGFNFGFPLYDYPRPTSVVVVQQPVATEVMPPIPGAGYVWVAGHWERDAAGNRWVWYGGSWQRPPAPNAIWQAGYWSQQGNTWAWVSSHWTVPAPAASTGPLAIPNPPSAPQTAPTPPTPPVSAQQEIVVNEAPPAPIVEEVYAAPGPDYAWIGGVWTWNGAWVWAPGHYLRAPYRGASWIGGSWHSRGGGWAWTGGHWR